MARILCALLLICLVVTLTAFAPSASNSMPRQAYHRNQLTMGNNAAFGIFSPAVYAAKFVLGDAKLNKVDEYKYITLYLVKLSSS